MLFADDAALTSHTSKILSRKTRKGAALTSVHGSSVQLTVQPGALLSERVNRGPRRRRATKTSLKCGQEEGEAAGA